MIFHKPEARPKGLRRFLGVVFILVCLIAAGVAYGVHDYYQDNLKAVSNSQKTVTITIPKGSTLDQVADILSQNGVIRSRKVFEQYVRAKGLQNKIQAGTYAIKPSQSVKEIVAIITEGKVASNLITITPGQRLDQIEQTFINAGFEPSAVKSALDPSLYAGHPALADKPASASLEGYLYPESFQRTTDTTPGQIISASLDEMAKRITPDFRQAVKKQGLTVHQGIILASIIEQEVSNPDDKPKVAQVFLKRLSIDMVLGSDVTAFYGSIINGQEPSVTYQSAYNTHYVKGLPPGPISNVTAQSLQAIITPANTDWLYFVAGDDGVTYFSKTIEEHEALTAQHCKKLCQ